jgi:hypothetical protein
MISPAATSSPIGAIGEHRGIFQDQVKLSSQTTRDHVACRFQA